jgi:MFS family permease
MAPAAYASQAEPVGDGGAAALLRRRSVLTTLVAIAVAIAFADSSVVVLALPDIYSSFNTSIQGVSWVITSYNIAVALVALGLVFVAHRSRAARVLGAGLIVFVGASIACAAAGNLTVLIASRAVQGAGGALLLAGSLPVLVKLSDSPARGAAVWTLAGTFGAALGPALGGVVTQVLDWRAIFAVQAPLAGVGLIALAFAHIEDTTELEEGWTPSLKRTLPANTCLGLVFGALVGVLFLAVLLVINGWGYSPIGGALIVSSLPVGALAARPLAQRLEPILAVTGGAALLALGLVALAVLPSSTVAYMVLALAFCGAGLGLAVPKLTESALEIGVDESRSGTLTVGIRHLGLVVAIVAIAPILAHQLPAAGNKATLRATAVLLDSPVPLTQKIPVALSMAKEFSAAKDGAVPDLAAPFNENGAGNDSQLAQTRDKLTAAVEETITQAFRPAFLFSAALAAAALVVAVLLRRRLLR